MHAESGDALRARDSHDSQGPRRSACSIWKARNSTISPRTTCRRCSILAAQLAVSLENARLYEQVARDEARMERELQAAQRMQGALLRPVPAGRFWRRSRRARSFRRAKSAATSTIFFATAPRASASAWATSAAKARPRRFTAPWRIGILRSLAPQKLLPGGTAEATQPFDLRAAHRGPLHDLLLCHLAQAHAQAARGQRRADAAVSAARAAIANS